MSRRKTPSFEQVQMALTRVIENETEANSNFTLPEALTADTISSVANVLNRNVILDTEAQRICDRVRATFLFQNYNKYQQAARRVLVFVKENPNQDLNTKTIKSIEGGAALYSAANQHGLDFKKIIAQLLPKPEADLIIDSLRIRQSAH